MTLRTMGGPLPSAAFSKELSFSELEDLHKYLKTVNEYQVSSLTLYQNVRNHGFQHELGHREDPDFSKASTATCVLSLLATDKWDQAGWSQYSERLAESLLLSKWSSAKLPINNVFTTAFILEAASALAPGGVSNKRAQRRFRQAELIVERGLASGYASVAGYPPSAYLTQLAVRALLLRDKLIPAVATAVQRWAWEEIHRQLALVQAHSKSADPYQLAYSVALVARLGDQRRTTPDQAQTLQVALDTVFAAQLPDGSWPRSQPLFHYPGVGTAHCYEYEMLVQLLSVEVLHDRLLQYFKHLSRAAYALSASVFELDEKALGWSSGHHPQFEGPESWSTASVFHFGHVLSRLLAELIRRWVFDDLEVEYTEPRVKNLPHAEFGPKLLDSTHALTHSRTHALTHLRTHALTHLRTHALTHSLTAHPPAQRRTAPSRGGRGGLDQAQAEASRLFRMLALTEQVVVLLDEFDEMVRDRGSASDVLSRFLTTSMLPKLATINRERRIVFIVATNYINNFDLAISRQGRFDLILQVMPPSFEEKMRHWPSVATKLNQLGLQDDPRVKEPLDALTFLEFETAAPKLERAATDGDVLRIIDDGGKRATLNARVGASTTQGGKEDNSTWRTASEGQAALIRIPEIQR